ncbi:MAG: phenylalanine--tRNA ligase subunit beta [Candidatus Dojkabacteria bacterium]|nr:phenylalanine--tRNA ligase subunit beta [Candidatus Dojkabacteria bacterium]
MKISLKTLKNISGIDLKLEELVSLIKNHIGQVESYHNIENDYKDIVVAQITKKEAHPDADKLCVYNIDYKSGTTTVVAGDKDLNVGDKVAYLKPGAVVPYSIYSLPEPIVISKRNMRGIDSDGMLGSKMELNIGMNHKHVMILPKDAPIGKSFSKYYGLDDCVIDIENKALTNRGDLFGLIGIARELCAITGTKFENPEWYTDYEKNIKPEINCLKIDIKNDAESLCTRYCAIVMDDIHIEKSPDWLRSLLLILGIPSINNIVDITNYISFLIGHPLHAFDYDKVVKNGDAEIHVRMAKQEESILCLDKKNHILDDKVIVIADKENPIGIAGMMGGVETAISDDTKRIIIESAMFDKTSIRRSSMRLGISTDSATKFKHSLDLNHCIVSLKKCVEMIKELTNAKIASEIIDIYDNEKSIIDIELNIEDINTILGTNLEKAIIINILTNLGYKILQKKGNSIHVEVPSWREDVKIREDIYEDIGRIYGYNNIESKLPKRDIKPVKENAIFELKRNIRNILSNCGANETDTYNFTNIDNIKKCTQNPDLAFIIKNPLAPELSLMRTSLNQSLLIKGSENTQRGFDTFVLYEMNIPHQKGLYDGNELPLENWYLSLFITDRNDSYSGSPFYLAKKYLERVFNSLNIENVSYILASESEQENLGIDIKNLMDLFDSNTSAIVYIGKDAIGVVGEYKNIVKENFKLAKYSAGFEINLNSIAGSVNGLKRYLDIPVYPSVIKDFCFEVDNSTKYIDIEREIRKVINKNKLFGITQCVDIYKKEDKDNTKRITIRIDIKHYEKTLSNTDIESISKDIIKTVKAKYSAKLI